MTVKTLFQVGSRLEVGYVEVNLLPGIPYLHIVGLPDASIKECGIKVKSALKSCGLEWPRGQQIVVSLRPTEFRKGGTGVDLAIAMAYLAASDQLPPSLKDLGDYIVWGELGLNGDVIAPHNLQQALFALKDAPLITGVPQGEIREGKWFELANLKNPQPLLRKKVFDHAEFWRRPELPSIHLHASAAQQLILSAHMELGVLLAGPQGSGKTTWAKILHTLARPPILERMYENAVLFGEDIWRSAWRPLEHPHHGITPQAMIGGGLPLSPGVISRAHGGVLIMDELLEFHPVVLEAMREPVESGSVTVARGGLRETFPCAFQLVGTTNLCPCGRMNPLKIQKRCGYSLLRCRSTTERLSGPILDRFDLLVLSHEWMQSTERVPLDTVVTRLEEIREFQNKRGLQKVFLPGWIADFGLSFRRQRAVLKVARGLADMEFSVPIRARHYSQAYGFVVTPMQKLREFFA